MNIIEQISELAHFPKELRFKEVQTIPHHYGYSLTNSKGSRFRFKKKLFQSITIVVHNNKVKKWYVGRVCKIILSQLPFVKP